MSEKLNHPAIRASRITAPHDCGDPRCPGNINRRKLEAFDRMREALNGFRDNALLERDHQKLAIAYEKACAVLNELEADCP